jgi:diacylglycerol kinase family enzyme
VKRRLGRLAYILAGIRELRGTETARFRVTVDGQVREYVAMEVHVVNIGTIAEPSIRWSDEVNPDDGRVNVFIVRARRLGDYVSVAGSILLGRPEKDTHIDHLPAEREVEISAKEPVTVQADGDPLGETPLRVTVRPRALEVIVRG